MNCPICDAECKVEEGDPSVGVMSSYFYCDACDKTFDCDPPDFEDDYR